MANYVLVDKDQLEADLTKVADSIRSKGGTSAKLAFPDGFKSAVDAIVISSGITVQRKTGTFTTSSSGTATVDCGFKPDLVVVHQGDTYNGYDCPYSFPFTERNKTKINSVIWEDDGDDNPIKDMSATQTSTGFSVTVKSWDYDWEDRYSDGSTYNYIAIKYT